MSQPKKQRSEKLESVSLEFNSADVGRYLSSTGDFTFEMEVVGLCRENGWSALHSGTYVDAVTGKNRQYDIQAEKTSGSRLVKLAIECKRISEEAPLVICQSRRTVSEGSHHILLCGGASHLQAIEIGRTFFAKDKWAGRSMTQVSKSGAGFRSSDSEVYDRWSQALASASSMIEPWSREVTINNANAMVAAILPLLVVPDATLSAANYSATKTLSENPTKVDRVNFYLGKTVEVGGEPDFEFPYLIIVTKTGLARLLHPDSDLFLRSLPQKRSGGASFESFCCR